jgi:hypothetical protein
MGISPKTAYEFEKRLFFSYQRCDGKTGNGHLYLTCS